MSTDPAAVAFTVQLILAPCLAGLGRRGQDESSGPDHIVMSLAAGTQLGSRSRTGGRGGSRHPVGDGAERPSGSGMRRMS